MIGLISEICFQLCTSQRIKRNKIPTSVIDPRTQENAFHDEVGISDRKPRVDYSANGVGKTGEKEKEANEFCLLVIAVNSWHRV